MMGHARLFVQTHKGQLELFFYSLPSVLGVRGGSRTHLMQNLKMLNTPSHIL
jgi:hypothetical protein